MNPMSDDDMLARNKATMPPGWLPDVSPVADTVLSGYSHVAAEMQNFLAWIVNQSRVATATDGILDLIALDFFGLQIKRQVNQSDDAFRKQIINEILRERVTRQGIVKAVADLTRVNVRFFEPFNVRDTGGFDTGYLGYDMLGRWGSLDLPRNFFVALVNPNSAAGIPNVDGFDGGKIGGGYDVGLEEYGDVADIEGQVTQQSIINTISQTRAAGVTAWLSLGHAPEARLDIDFILGSSELV